MRPRPPRPFSRRPFPTRPHAGLALACAAAALAAPTACARFRQAAGPRGGGPPLPAAVPPVAGPVRTQYVMRYVDVALGTGAPAEPGRVYAVHYTGWLRDGTRFDSSRDRGQPIRFEQGKRRVIPGWDAGFEGMRVGGRRRLFIPYQLAYGERGRGPIPPRAELIFDVELVGVETTPAPEAAVGTPGGVPLPPAGTLAYVGPFAVFMAWLALDRYVPLANPAKEVVRDLVVLAGVVGFARPLLPRALRPTRPLAGVALGLAVFALWVAPDVLVPGWRGHWLFQNAVTGSLKTSIPPAELTPLMLALRTARATLLVPVLEELFWRGWLPRWLQDTHFERVALGRYTPLAFWGTALLFAAEHGPYWEVGLLCGVVYNAWMARTRALGDLVLAHAVTNLALSLFVIGTGRWTFWM